MFGPWPRTPPFFIYFLSAAHDNCGCYFVRIQKRALGHRKARHAALRRMAELQESEQTFKFKQLEFEKEMWEVERGMQVKGEEYSSNSK